MSGTAQTQERPGGYDDSLLVPEGTTVLHIGPPKTATTAVQGAFWAARDEVARQGVGYPGRTRHSAAAVIAALGRPGLFSYSEQPSTARWDALCAEVAESSASRVVVSSEFFAEATSEQVPTVVDRLRREHVHVVVTLRPLVRIVPSHWQQSVQGGAPWSFDQWLHAAFDADGRDDLQAGFWVRHRHDELVARWADVVGADNVTVIVLDAANPDLVLTTFEQLVGLAPGTLVAPVDLTNRSLTWPEVEALRAFNATLLDAGLPRGTRRRLGRAGAAHYLKQFPADPDAPRIDLPAWVRPAVEAVATEIKDNLAQSPVRVVGDLALLTPAAPEGYDPVMPDPPVITREIAARMAVGVAAATGALPWDDLGVTAAMPPLFTAEPARDPAKAPKTTKAKEASRGGMSRRARGLARRLRPASDGVRRNET